jgi:ribosomal protein L29
MHAWNTRELEIEVEQLKRELAPLRAMEASRPTPDQLEKIK